MRTSSPVPCLACRAPAVAGFVAAILLAAALVTVMRAVTAPGEPVLSAVADAIAPAQAARR